MEQAGKPVIEIGERCQIEITNKMKYVAIAILNHLCNSCRGKPPVVARFDRGRHAPSTTPTYFANHLGLLYDESLFQGAI